MQLVLESVIEFVQMWTGDHVLCNIGGGGHRFWTNLKCPKWHLAAAEFTSYVPISPSLFHSCRGILTIFFIFYVGAYFPKNSTKVIFQISCDFWVTLNDNEKVAKVATKKIVEKNACLLQGGKKIIQSVFPYKSPKTRKKNSWKKCHISSRGIIFFNWMFSLQKVKW